MSENRCVRCGATIEGGASYLSGDGEICQSCHAEEEASSKLPSLGVPGFSIICGIVPFFLTLEFNGYDFAELVLGGVGAVAGLVALVQAIKAPAMGRTKALGIALIGLGLCIYQVVQGF